MALFEAYERRIDQINAVLNSYGISSIEEAEKITKDAGLDVYDQVKENPANLFRERLLGIHSWCSNRNHFQKEGSDELAGFDMDLIRAIGKKLGYKVEIANMGFDALIPALNTGNIDVAIAGMSITDERKQAVGMSDPYYTSGLIVMVKKDNNDIKSIDDLAGKRIAAQIGTTGADKANSVKDAKVTLFNTNTESAMELTNGGVDAVINDSPVIGYYLAQGGSEVAKTVGDVMEAEQYGIAVKKDNTKLLEDINKALAELKKRRRI